MPKESEKECGMQGDISLEGNPQYTRKSSEKHKNANVGSVERARRHSYHGKRKKIRLRNSEQEGR